MVSFLNLLELFGFWVPGWYCFKYNDLNRHISIKDAPPLSVLLSTVAYMDSSLSTPQNQWDESTVNTGSQPSCLPLQPNDQGPPVGYFRLGEDPRRGRVDSQRDPRMVAPTANAMQNTQIHIRGHPLESPTETQYTSGQTYSRGVGSREELVDIDNTNQMTSTPDYRASNSSVESPTRNFHTSTHAGADMWNGRSSMSPLDFSSDYQDGHDPDFILTSRHVNGNGHRSSSPQAGTIESMDTSDNAWLSGPIYSSPTEMETALPSSLSEGNDERWVHERLPFLNLEWFQEQLQRQNPMALVFADSYLAIGTCGNPDSGRILIMNLANGTYGRCRIKSLTHFMLHSAQNRSNSLSPTWVILAKNGYVFANILKEDNVTVKVKKLICFTEAPTVSCLKPIPGHPFAVNVSESQATDTINVQVMDLENFGIHTTFTMAKPFISLDIQGKRLAICAGGRCQVWDWQSTKLIASTEMDYCQSISLGEETHLLIGARSGRIYSFSASSGTFDPTGYFPIPSHLGEPHILSIKIIPETGIAVAIYRDDVGSKRKIIVCFYDVPSRTILTSWDTDNSTIFCLLPNDTLDLLHQDHSLLNIIVVKAHNGPGFLKHFRLPFKVCQMGYSQDCITLLAWVKDKFSLVIYRFLKTTSGDWEMVRIQSS